MHSRSKQYKMFTVSRTARLLEAHSHSCPQITTLHYKKSQKPTTQLA